MDTGHGHPAHHGAPHHLHRKPECRLDSVAFMNRTMLFWFLSFFKDFIDLFLKRWGGRKRNINVWLPLTRPPTGDLACSPGRCPDWESNQQPPGSQAGTQSTEPHRSGQDHVNVESTMPPGLRSHPTLSCPHGASLACLCHPVSSTSCH